MAVTFGAGRRPHVIDTARLGPLETEKAPMRRTSIVNTVIDSVAILTALALAVPFALVLGAPFLGSL